MLFQRWSNAFSSSRCCAIAEDDQSRCPEGCSTRGISSCENGWHRERHFQKSLEKETMESGGAAKPTIGPPQRTTKPTTTPSAEIQRRMGKLRESLSTISPTLTSAHLDPAFIIKAAHAINMERVGPPPTLIGIAAIRF